MLKVGINRMKKYSAKRKSTRVKKSSRRRSWKYNKGSLGAGLGYILIGIMAIMGLGIMMSGGSAPILNDDPKAVTTPLPVTPESSKNNLQLYTFPATSPQPTVTPTNPPQPQERGGSNYGSPPGGNSAPGGGSGGTSGAAI